MTHRIRRKTLQHAKKKKKKKKEIERKVRERNWEKETGRKRKYS
jgi:predicted nucleic acid-binding Zn ribbon protein